jgi:hypothetical protein
MTTMTLQAEIGPDGKLRLELPCNLPPGPAEVVVVVQPTANPPVPAGPATPPFRARSGLFVGKAQSGGAIDAALAEMNALWQTKLQDLHR